MSKQGVSTVENVGNGIELMFTELDFGIHTAEHDMRTVILTRSRGVEQFIILGDKLLSSVGVSPNPFLERILDSLLFLLGEGGFLGVEYTAFLAIGVGYSVIDTNVTEVQRIL